MQAMYSIKTPIYQSAQIRELERIAQERFSLTENTMMQRAGKAAFDFLARRWPQAQKIAVFCGAGNNGGDGYVLALFAQERGLKVTIWQVGNHENLKNAVKEAYEACLKAKMPMAPLDNKADLAHPDVIVDAVCGMGVHGNLREDAVTAIEKMQSGHAPILAIDVPT